MNLYTSPCRSAASIWTSMNTNFSSFLVLHLNAIHGSICIPYYQYVSVSICIPYYQYVSLSSMRWVCWHIWENLYSLKTESTIWWICGCGRSFSSDCEKLLLGKTWSGTSPQNKDLHYNGVVMILFLRLTNYQNPILKGVVNFGLKEKAVIKNLFANLRSKPSQFI